MRSGYALREAEYVHGGQLGCGRLGRASDEPGCRLDGTGMMETSWVDLFGDGADCIETCTVALESLWQRYMYFYAARGDKSWNLTWLILSPWPLDSGTVTPTNQSEIRTLTASPLDLPPLATLIYFARLAQKKPIVVYVFVQEGPPTCPWLPSANAGCGGSSTRSR